METSIQTITTLTPATLLEACMYLCGHKGGTIHEHTPRLSWRKAHWRSRTGWQFDWALDYTSNTPLPGAGNATVWPVCSWKGQTRADTPPAIDAELFRNERAAPESFTIYS